jgi:hypothetical protein
MKKPDNRQKDKTIGRCVDKPQDGKSIAPPKPPIVAEMAAGSGVDLPRRQLKDRTIEFSRARSVHYHWLQISACLNWWGER